MAVPESASIGLISLIALAVGSALGGVTRVLLVAASTKRWGARFPWGTLAVNLSGAFAAGWLGALILTGAMEPATTLFLLTGFLGSYTTVSALSLHTLLLAREGRGAAALGYLGATVFPGLLLVGVGFAMGRAVHG